MKCNISERVMKDIVVFAKKNSVNKITLFGSRARGTNSQRSDIDIAVYGGYRLRPVRCARRSDADNDPWRSRVQAGV